MATRARSGACAPCSSAEKHGYDCDFVQPPPSYPQTECFICLLVLRTPQLISCCGHNFCKDCINSVRKKGNGCPLCNAKEFTFVYNRVHDVALQELEVYCTHRMIGCDWKGRLEKLDEHLNVDPTHEKQTKGCRFVEVTCCHNGCGQTIQRRKVVAHQNYECPKRPFSCKHCKTFETTYEDVTMNHWPECNCYPVLCPNRCFETTMERQSLEEHLMKCPLQVIECEFKHAGCKTTLLRKDMPDHISDSEELVRHVSLLAKQNKKLTTEFKKDELQGEVVAPVRIVMTDFEQHKRDNESWYSVGFYTHPRGYKMCLRVDANGNKTGEGTHVSCYFFLMRGKFDNQLKWPFEADVTFKLLNQRQNKEHYSKVITDFRNVGTQLTNSQVTSGDIAEKGQGYSNFISHGDLEYNAATNCQYLMNDCLFFEVKVKL